VNDDAATSSRWITSEHPDLPNPRSCTTFAVSVAAGIALLSSVAWTSMAAAQQTRAPSAPRTAVKVETIATGLEHPWSLQFLPGGRLLVTERPGRLRLVSPEGVLSPPIDGVPQVHVGGQAGLLDIALAPDFARTNDIYLSFSGLLDGKSSGTTVARGKLEITGTGGRLTSVATIFRQLPSEITGGHFGSRIVFTDNDTFFLTVGDRMSGSKHAQNPANHIGKIMRLARDGTPAPGNPQLPGWDAAIWSIGHRNIQGATLHPSTGELWVADHGARGGDEVNIVRKGLNYGWPVISYGIDYSGVKIGEGTAKAGLEQPLYYWDPSIAPSGAAFYTGELFPTWKGNLLVGGLGGRHLVRLVLEGERVVAEEQLINRHNFRIRDVRVGPDGAVWLLVDQSNGRILRLTPG